MADISIVAILPKTNVTAAQIKSQLSAAGVRKRTITDSQIDSFNSSYGYDGSGNKHVFFWQQLIELVRRRIDRSRSDIAVSDARFVIANDLSTFDEDNA